MRVAFHSPMPPSESGIADYSEALVQAMRPLADIDIQINGDARQGDIALYQIGNNSHHVAAYEAALRHPGVVVLHEANLHHLIAERTIRRNDWDSYLRELEHDGGAEALEYGKRARTLEIGPDYAGVPLLRRLLESARGLIVHSRYVEDKARQAGYRGPVAVIPHGAWIPELDVAAERAKLGLRAPGTAQDAPLVGIFGHLKPYKRIPQALRAFARLARQAPEAKLVLAGEEHSDLPLKPMLAELGLNGNVRHLGKCDNATFAGAIGACDIVMNLRYPTVGETSGTLLRALGMGKAVLVSDVGAFAEFPEEVCLRVPVDVHEEELLYEYLKLMTERADLRRALGQRARNWVSSECSWDQVAERYARFLHQVAAGPALMEVPDAPPSKHPVTAAYLEEWAQPESLGYLHNHMARLLKTLEMTPAGARRDSVLEMGVYMQITPALKSKLGYGRVRGCYLGPAGVVDRKRVVSTRGDVFECNIDLFDAERDPFPYPDESFATVICGELVEHLAFDPMHMMSEINRILRPDGHLVLTTPNAASARAIAAILDSYHPGFFTTYLRPLPDGSRRDQRHSREYTAKEAYRLLMDAGFEIVRIETGEFTENADAPYAWVKDLLNERNHASDLRGDGTYLLGRKAGPVRDRWPNWLYS